MRRLRAGVVTRAAAKLRRVFEEDTNSDRILLDEDDWLAVVLAARLNQREDAIQPVKTSRHDLQVVGAVRQSEGVPISCSVAPMRGLDFAHVVAGLSANALGQSARCEDLRHRLII